MTLGVAATSTRPVHVVPLYDDLPRRRLPRRLAISPNYLKRWHVLLCYNLGDGVAREQRFVDVYNWEWKGMSDLQELLAELDRGNHRQRWAHIVTFTRSHDAAGLSAYQDELDKGSLFERYVSLQISVVSRNTARVAECLNSESRMLRKLAAACILKICSDEAFFVETVLGAAGPVQSSLLKQVGHNNHRALAERLLPHVQEAGPKKIAWLLAACNEESVRKHLRDCEPHFSMWRQLAARHPDLTLEFIQERFQETPENLRYGLWYRFSPTIEVLARTHAMAIVDLFKEHCRSVIRLSRTLQTLLMRLYHEAPDEIAEVVFSDQSLKLFRRHGVPACLARRANRFSDEHLMMLVSGLLPKSQQLVSVFRQLAPSRRRQLMLALTERGGLESNWDEGFLEMLPHDLRHAETRRILAGESARLQQNRRLRLTALLPFDEALPLLEQASRDAKADRRGAAYGQLVRSAALNRRMADALSVLARIKNEQDPVRREVFSQLSQASPAVFNDEHVGLIEPLVQSALDARDTSHSTAASLQQWLMRLLSQHCPRVDGALREMCLRLLGQIRRQRGPLHLPQLPLPRGAEIALTDALADVIRGANQRERYALVLQLAANLWRRGWQVPRLQDMLQQALSAHNKSTRATAIHHWLANPKTRDQRVEQLVAEDPSVITQPRVFQHVHRRRQDLLDRFLDGSATKGHFLSGRNVHLLPATGGFHTWLPRQQKAFAKLLELWMSKKGVSDVERRLALSIKATLPTTTAADFSRSLNSSHVPVVEGALAALPKLDRIGEGIPILLDHVGDDQARVAMYALHRCLREVPTDRQLQILSGVLQRPQARVTVQKEAVRLLGGLGSEESIDLLARHAASTDLHRDVRIALGHAARQLLHDARAWQILQRLADDPDADIGVSLLEAGAYGMNAKDQAQYAKFLLPLADHPAEKVRKAFFVNAYQWRRGQVAVFAEAAGNRLSQTEDSPEWEAAARCLVDCCDVEGAAAHLVKAVGTLAAAPRQPNADASRDCPALQRLHDLVARVEQLPFRQRKSLSPALEEAANPLLDDPGTERLGLKLLLAAVKWKTVASQAQLQKICRWLEPRAWLMGDYLDGVTHSLKAQEASVTKDFLPVVDVLASSDLRAGRMTAFTILHQMGSDRKWPDYCRDRLRQFRDDEDAGIRSVAYTAFSCRESSEAMEYGYDDDDFYSEFADY